MEDASLWFETNQPDTEQHRSPRLPQDSSVKWLRPPVGFAKCNIGTSWVGPNSNSGAAWILRDDQGKPILHSRRAFSNLNSEREAELVGLHWAISDMIAIRRQKVIFESSNALARESVMQPADYKELHGLLEGINRQLSRLRDWSVDHVRLERNTIADDLAKSVTADRRYQSFIATGGPSWLQSRLADEV